jgi:hypothetical protein
MVLQFSSLFNNVVFLLIRQSFRQCLHLFSLEGFLLGVLLVIRCVVETQEMRVAVEMFIDQTFEKSTLLEIRSDALRVLIDLEQVQGVTTVQGLRNHVGNVH